MNNKKQSENNPNTFPSRESDLENTNIVLVDENHNTIVEFTPVPENFNLDNFIPLDAPLLSQNIGSQLTAAGVLGNITRTGTGLYRSTVDPSQLMIYKDGTTSSIIRRGGRFVEHHGFQSASTMSIFAPILIFQVASILTGQYYLNGITDQLSNISAQLDRLINDINDRDVASLKTRWKLLLDLHKKKQASSEDFTSLSNIEKDLLDIRNTYEERLKRNTGTTYRKELDKEKSKSTFTSGKINDLRSFNERTNLVFDIQILAYSEWLLQLRKVVYLELSTHCQPSEREERASGFCEVLASLQNWNVNELQEYFTKASESLNALSVSAHIIELDASINAKLANDFRKFLAEQTQKMTDIINCYNNNANELKTEVGKLTLVKKREVIYDHRTGRILISRT